MLGHSPRRRTIVEQTRHGVAQRASVARGEAQAGDPWLDDVTQPAGVGDRERRARRRGFQGDEPGRLVQRRDDHGVGCPEKRGEPARRDESRPLHGIAERASRRSQLFVEGTRARDHEPRAAELTTQAGQRFEQRLHALLVHQPPGEHDQRTVAGKPRTSRVARGVRREPCVGVEAVRHDVEVRCRHVEHPSHLVVHEGRAGDDARRLVHEPALDGMHHAVQWIGQPPSMAPGFGRVDRGNDRLLGEPGDRDGALRHQPVVGVDHVRTPSAHERQRGANQRVLERLRPGQQALGGEVQVDRIDGCAVYVDALVRAVAQPGAAAADDAHLVIGCREFGRECAHMPPETADDQRRILP